VTAPWAAAGDEREAGRDVARTFLRWTFSRAVCHKGYVLVSGLGLARQPARRRGFWILVKNRCYHDVF
jgi:hypothetical protein